MGIGVDMVNQMTRQKKKVGADKTSGKNEELKGHI